METTATNAISRALQKMLEVDEKGVNEFDRMERGLLTENARSIYGITEEEAKKEIKRVKHDRAIAEAAGGRVPSPLVVLFLSFVVVQEIVTLINDEIAATASAGANEAELEALRAELQTALSDKNGLQVQLDSADADALQARVAALEAAIAQAKEADTLNDAVEILAAALEAGSSGGSGD